MAKVHSSRGSDPSVTGRQHEPTSFHTPYQLTNPNRSETTVETATHRAFLLAYLRKREREALWCRADYARQHATGKTSSQRHPGASTSKFSCLCKVRTVKIPYAVGTSETMSVSQPRSLARTFNINSCVLRPIRTMWLAIGRYTTRRHNLWVLCPPTHTL